LRKKKKLLKKTRRYSDEDNGADIFEGDDDDIFGKDSV